MGMAPQPSPHRALTPVDTWEERDTPTQECLERHRVTETRAHRGSNERKREACQSRNEKGRISPQQEVLGKMTRTCRKTTALRAPSVAAPYPGTPGEHQHQAPGPCLSRRRVLTWMMGPQRRWDVPGGGHLQCAPRGQLSPPQAVGALCAHPAGKEPGQGPRGVGRWRAPSAAGWRAATSPLCPPANTGSRQEPGACVHSCPTVWGPSERESEHVLLYRTLWGLPASAEKPRPS